MEFFATADGHLIAILLMLMGAGEIIAARLTFGRKIEKLKKSKSPLMSESDKTEVDLTVIKLNKAMRFMQLAGGVFLVIGYFGYGMLHT